MSRIRPANVALRDQLLAVLRGSGQAMRTEELIKATHSRPADVSHHRWFWRYYGNTYAQLRALARLGLVDWRPTNGVSATWWKAAPFDPETGITIADLEQLLSEDA